jgi:hypothetical protein
MFRKDNFRTGHIGSVGINHLHKEQSQPQQQPQQSDRQPESVFKAPVEKRKKLKFQRQ